MTKQTQAARAAYYQALARNDAAALEAARDALDAAIGAHLDALSDDRDEVVE